MSATGGQKTSSAETGPARATAEGPPTVAMAAVKDAATEATEAASAASVLVVGAEGKAMSARLVHVRR